MILFFDTETTGKWNFKAPVEDESQPRLVQLACILQTDDAKTKARLDLIVQPEGTTIPDEASRIHGITTETAHVYGVPLGLAMALFSALLLKTEECVAYNADFDRKVMQRAGLLSNGDPDIFHPTMKWSDPMKDATDWCKLPGPYGNKWPKLGEAYEFFFGSPLAGAHNALADVSATVKLYWLLKKIGRAPGFAA